MATMQITVLSGKGARGACRFEKDTIAIGRAAEADLRLDPEDNVCASGIHARVLRQGARWRVAVDHRNGVTLHESAGPRFLAQGQTVDLPSAIEMTIGRNGPRLGIRGDSVAPSRIDRGIAVQILTGACAPTIREFDQDEITIGRTQQADVRLDPQRDLACASGIHARLLRASGSWQIEAVHASGVLIRAKRRPTITVAQGTKHTLNGPAEITLGRSGPRLRITPKNAASDLPMTYAGNDGGFSSRIAPLLQERLADITRGGPWRIPLAIAALVVVVALAMAVNGWRQPGPEDLRRHLAEARESVFLVGFVREDGNFTPCGTAWVVRKRMLATNAHVVDALQNMADNGLRLLARLPGTPPRDITIDSMTVHPGYRRLEPLMNASFQTRSGKRDSMLPSFDVGLIRVNEDAGRPLELAGDNEARRIRGGMAVGYVGFPMENISGVQGNQPPTIVTGDITAVHDALGQCAADRMNILLQHNLQITGGSSGSPILNAAGHVIGLNNAGHMIFLPDKRMSVGLNLAQRIDLLREMLDDRAAKELADHERYLVPQIRAAGANLVDLVGARIRRHVAEWMQAGEINEASPLQLQAPWIETLKEPTRSRTFAVSIDRDRRYALVACAADFSSLKLELEINGHIEESSEGLCPSIAMRSAYHGPATIRVNSTSNSGGTPRVVVQLAEIAN